MNQPARLLIQRREMHKAAGPTNLLKKDWRGSEPYQSRNKEPFDFVVKKFQRLGQESFNYCQKVQKNWTDY